MWKSEDKYGRHSVPVPIEHTFKVLFTGKLLNMLRNSEACLAAVANLIYHLHWYTTARPVSCVTGSWMSRPAPGPAFVPLASRHGFGADLVCGESLAGNGALGVLPIGAGDARVSLNWRGGLACEVGSGMTQRVARLG